MCTIYIEESDQSVCNLLQLDEEGIGRVAVPDNALDELDTIMIGGILNSQFAEMTDTADYIRYSNFTGCLSGKYIVYSRNKKKWTGPSVWSGFTLFA